MDAWLNFAADQHGLAEPCLPGDANLDGDVEDLNAMGIAWQSQNMPLWTRGDFFPDGTINLTALCCCLSACGSQAISSAVLVCSFVSGIANSIRLLELAAAKLKS